MNVARTTVQAIYGTARRKLAQCLVEGRGLVIEGGDYELCSAASAEECPGWGLPRALPVEYLPNRQGG